MKMKKVISLSISLRRFWKRLLCLLQKKSTEWWGRWRM